MYTFDPIDISEINNNLKKSKSFEKNTDGDDKINKKQSKYYKENYNEFTTQTLRVKRIQGRNIFDDEIIPDEECFKFYQVWDSATGTRLEKFDEYGPICYDVFDLCYSIYIKRLNGLWHEPDNEFAGHYGQFLGTGKNINIISRGSYPEKYLFRLPNCDAYVHKNIKSSYVTYTPILNDEEIKELDTKLDNILKKYNKKISNHISSGLISKIKFHYDEALNPNPDKSDKIFKEITEENPEFSENDLIYNYNKYHVDQLRSM